MDFKVYVPKGFSKLGKASLPNLEETSDPERIFTAESRMKTGGSK